MFELTYYHFFLSIICMFLNIIAFFPIQKSVLKIVDPPNKLYSHEFNLTQHYKPEIDRLVFILIDALREDFITEENMPYLYKNMDCAMTVEVEPPTVTLLRLKALITGDVPQFIDIISNIGGARKLDDSFLHRAHAANKKIVFYGDDTWLILFPNMFLREDRVYGYYINDFTEVDTNVTRHIDDELKKTDWDIMVLHYIGLDHIGHVFSPFSDLVKPKLNEMDEVVQKIDEASKQWDRKTMILVTGDHGIKDSGGHGGRTYGETHVPLITFGKKCDKTTTKISQSDIPTTLSMLFGIQIPGNSVGKIITNLFKSSEIERILYLMYYNLFTLSQGTEKCSETVQMHYEGLMLHSINHSLVEEYEKCLNQLSSDLIQSSVKRDWNLIIISMLLCVFLMVIILNFKSKHLINKLLPTVIVIFSLIFYKNSFLFILITALLIMLILFYSQKVWNSFNKIYFVPMFLHIILLEASSSFVDEEHQIFYFYTGTVSILLSYVLIKKSLFDLAIALAPIIVLRFIRTINMTGEQTVSYPVLRDWLLLADNLIYLKTFYAISLILIICSLLAIDKIRAMESILIPTILFATYVFRMHFPNKVQFAQLIFFMIMIASIKQLFNDNKITNKLLIIWILITSLLIKPYNAILIPVCVFVSHINFKYFKNIQFLTLLQLWLGWTLFFCQGHSNSIANNDLTPGFIPLNSYIPVVVFLLNTCHMYTFPSLSFLLILDKSPANADVILTLNIVNRLLIFITVCSLNLLHCDHILIWSLFAPKLLFETVHTLLIFVFSTCYMFKYCKIHK